jgi:hypothetical protein
VWALVAQLNELTTPRLRIVYEPWPPYLNIGRTHDDLGNPTEHERQFSIGIENLSQAHSIDNVSVQMVHMKGTRRDRLPVDDARPFALQLDDTGSG